MIFKTVYKRIFLFAVFCEIMFPVVAQSLPDAGQTLRDLHSHEGGIQFSKPVIQQPSSVPELPTTAVAESSVINVASIRITGASAVSPAELAPLVLPWVGRKLSFSQLNEAANRITQYYRDLGYLVARAYVPAQTPSNGVIEIAVLEGKLGTLKLQNSSRIAESSLRKLASQVNLGEAFQGRRAEGGFCL